MENKENVIEYLSGSHTATVTFTNQKEINRIKKIYEERADEFKSYHLNKDGSVCARIPKSWVKINPGSKPGSRPKREMTEEEKQALRERLAAGRKNKGKN